MARKAQLKTVYRKTKIILTYRGRKVFEAKGIYASDKIKSFAQGWHQPWPDEALDDFNYVGSRHHY